MTHPLKLLIATHNPAKKQELWNGFAPLLISKINLLFLDDLHITNEPEETGKTFEENARLKAEYFADISHLPTVADDGGIEIDALGGEPGVKSRRWLGYDASDKELIDYTLLRMKDIPKDKRTARFKVVLHYVNPETKKWSAITTSIEGSIALHASEKRVDGFPYRTLFIVHRFDKNYEDLSPEEYSQVGHRLQAVKKLIPLIKQDLLQ